LYVEKYANAKPVSAHKISECNDAVSDIMTVFS